MDYKREDLTKAMRWQIAEWIAEDRLPAVNEKLEDVVFQETFYTRYGKRMLDILLSLVVLLITLPINLAIGIITYFDVGNPIFFTQERVGKDGKIFRIVKFRNMRNTRDERGELLPPSQRVTEWGKFVRKTSLDELLNFWSILKGDMSLIGPRPLPPEYMVRYNKRHRARIKVRPGLECPPRMKLDHPWTWQERLDNDIWYVEHISLKTDIKMCWYLLRFTFDRKTATMRAFAHTGIFMGYDDQTGTAIYLQDVPEEYIERAFDERKQWMTAV